MTKTNLMFYMLTFICLVFNPANPVFASTILSAVHGINGRDLGSSALYPIDISIDDTCIFANIVSGEISDFSRFEAGTYQINIAPAVTKAPCSAEPILSTEATLEDKTIYSTIVHLDADGGLTVSVLGNEVPTGLRDTLVIFRHTAAAPMVDVKISRGRISPISSAFIEDLAPGDEAQLVTRGGNYMAKILLADTETKILRVPSIPVAPQVTTVVYVAGSAETDTLDAIVQLIPRQLLTLQ